MAEAELQALLLSTDTDTYFIEYQKFLSNHISHGIIALHRIGADRQSIQHFIKHYAKKLEPVASDIVSGKVAIDSKGELDDATLKKLKGQRTDFYPLRRHFETLLGRHGDVAELVHHEYPKIADGMIGSALHALIQLGYGISSDTGMLVCEGLAYLHHSHIPIIYDGHDPRNHLKHFGKGQEELLDLVREIYDNKELLAFMKKEEHCSRSLWVSSYYQYRACALMTKKGAYLIRLANRCQLPEGVDPDAADMAQITRVADWLIDTAIYVYAGCERINEFFLLHGVTGAWSLKQVLLQLSPTDALESLRVYICVLLVTLAAEECPGIDDSFDVSRLSEPNDETWGEIKRNVLANVTRDEHISKLVQICFERWTQNPASGKLYIEASRIAIDNPLSFPPKSTQGFP